ncbi:ATP-binding protein [Kitasatospora sp. NPDC002227]|uniref:ATP-binding protein n=1 Tax=Kitasatospora sp. NPDC002227 TaxID=3154773 RepID=UPI00331EEB1A
MTTAPAVRPGMLPPERADHYLNLTDARVVATEALRTTQDNIAATLQARAMMVLSGAAGNGKSFSVNATLRHLAPRNTYRVAFRARPTPRDIRHELFRALALPGEPPLRPIEFDTVLKDALARSFHVLVCDEAQWLSRECFEYWRYLWDDPATDIAVVFAGGDGCAKVLRREPMLASRVFIWQQALPLTLPEVLATIPAFHPMWDGVDADLITLVDKQAAHGNFRAWARITKHAADGLAAQGRTHVDEHLLRQVYQRLGTSA